MKHIVIIEQSRFLLILLVRLRSYVGYAIASPVTLSSVLSAQYYFATGKCSISFESLL